MNEVRTLEKKSTRVYENFPDFDQNAHETTFLQKKVDRPDTFLAKNRGSFT